MLTPPRPDNLLVAARPPRLALRETRLGQKSRNHMHGVLSSTAIDASPQRLTVKRDLKSIHSRRIRRTQSLCPCRTSAANCVGFIAANTRRYKSCLGAPRFKVKNSCRLSRLFGPNRAIASLQTQLKLVARSSLVRNAWSPPFSPRGAFLHDQKLEGHVRPGSASVLSTKHF